MKNFKSFGIFAILLIALTTNFTVNAQIVGPAGTRLISRLGTGSLGSPGDLQIAGPGIAGQGPAACVSGLNYNYANGNLLVDSLPITNSNNFISVDTTVSDTVILKFGYTNIIVNRWGNIGITTLVFVLPLPPSNVTALSGSQADNFVTTVKYTVANTTANVIKVRTDTGYLTLYSATKANASDTKSYFYSSGSASYY